MFMHSASLEFDKSARSRVGIRCGEAARAFRPTSRARHLIQARHITLSLRKAKMLSMMLAASPSVLVLSPSLVQHAYNPYSQLMPSYHPSLSYNPLKVFCIEFCRAAWYSCCHMTGLD